MRIGSEAPKRRTHSSNRHESQGALPGFRHLELSSAFHHKRTDKAETVGVPFNILHSLRRTQNDAVRHNALPHEPPQGDQKFARQGDHHGLARTAGVRVVLNHCAKALSFWCRRNRHANWIMPRRTRPLPERASPFPAFSGCSRRASREAGITGYGPSVAQASRQHLVYQHVSRLDADPDYARQQAHHSVRSITGRVIETLQACLLNLPDLIPDEPSPLHVAPQAQLACSAVLARPRACVNRQGARRPFSAWD